MAESQAANGTKLIERLRIATPDQKTKSAIGQGEGRTETELRKAWSHEEGRGFGPPWEKRQSGGLHWWHREEFYNSYSLKNKWRELSLLPPATISSSELWKQAHAVAWCMIKALHIHHCAKKMYPKKFTPCHRTPKLEPKWLSKVPLMTVHLLIISQQASSNASFPAQSSLSHLLNRVHLPSPCTLNQFYDFIFVATTFCLEKERLLTRDSVIFKVIYFMRALK